MKTIKERPMEIVTAEAVKSANNPGHAGPSEDLRWHGLLGQQDLLRDEIQRGNECLQQVRKRLAESRSVLEDWPSYEERCGVNALPGLTESVLINKRIERFLASWLNRRQKQLTQVDQAIQRLGKASGAARPYAGTRNVPAEANPSFNPVLVPVEAAQGASAERVAA